jgi:hypothetical protein
MLEVNMKLSGEGLGVALNKQKVASFRHIACHPLNIVD